MAEVEKLLTVGTQDNLRARAFLSCVYGGGLRLSEATHIQIKDLDSARHRLLVSHPKGGRQRYTLLSENLLGVLREVEAASRIPVTGLVANTHLMEETTPEIVEGGLAATRELSAATGIPVRFCAALRRLAGTLAGLDCPLLPIDRKLLPPEQRRYRARPGRPPPGLPRRAPGRPCCRPSRH